MKTVSLPRSSRALLALGYILPMLWLPYRAHGAGVVGDGSIESCTEAALDSALAGGGLVTFDCGAGPHTILLSFAKGIADATEIDGGGLISLSGGNSTSLFQVYNGATLALTDLTLTRGFGLYGAIENFGALTMTDSRIDNCNATVSGGAIASYGTLVLTDSVITANATDGPGGGIYSDGGSITITRGEISNNQAQDFSSGGGGVYAVGGALTLIDAVVTGNATSGVGGGIYGDDTEITIEGGEISDSDVGAASGTGGGAVYSSGTLRLTGVTIANNSVVGPTGSGAGIYQAAGSVEVFDSVLSGNAAQAGYAGAVYIAETAAGTIERTTLDANSALNGGAIVNMGILTIRDTTLHENVALAFSAIGNGVAGAPPDPPGLTLTNVTISGNAATGDGYGALACSSASATLTYVSIVGTTGEAGIGLYSTCDLHLRNTVISGNGDTNCVGPIVPSSDGFNLSSDFTCGTSQASDQSGVDPLLGPLQDNSGPTLTHAPLAGSPLIDAAQCLVEVTADQREVSRPQGAACDVGAVEYTPEIASNCADPVLVASAFAPDSRANAVTASDALAILSAAVGVTTCELCVCDVDGSGSVAATDALATLQVAVGLAVELQCPSCT